MKDYHALLATRLGGGVTRYHTHPTQRVQTVAEHSFGVANIVLFLTEGNASGGLLREALWHDVSEAATGDIPAPAKWDSPDLKRILDDLETNHRERHGLDTNLFPHEVKLLKFADMSELVLWSLEEYNLGNKYASRLITRGLVVLDRLRSAEQLRPFDRVQELYNTMSEEFHND